MMFDYKQVKTLKIMMCTFHRNLVRTVQLRLSYGGLSHRETCLCHQNVNMSCPVLTLAVQACTLFTKIAYPRGI